ncbi:NPCBM/NEW2 domain-containing protein [Gottfriedia acidiceleris]|uniref:NPCBM/NEW2 domain-containing protein n=1 Tax=Gottfriedia acidiceleris TaxID=371036 RepID=UPI002FFE65F6
MYTSPSSQAATTVKQLQAEIKRLKGIITQRDKTIATQKTTISTRDKTIASLKATIAARDNTIANYKSTIVTRDKTIATLKTTQYTPSTSYLSRPSLLPSKYTEGTVSGPSLVRINGITYSPLNLVTSQLGFKSFYDKATNILYLKNPNGYYLKDVVGDPYYSIANDFEYLPYNDNNKKMYKSFGEDIPKGFVFHKNSVSGDNIDGVTSFALKGKYTHFNALVGYVDTSATSHDARPFHLTVLGDGKILFEQDVNENNSVADCDVNVTGVNSLTFKFNFDGDTQVDYFRVNETKIAIGNAIVK